MKKGISSIFYSLATLFVISIIIIGICQFVIIKNNDAYLTSEEIELLEKYIQTTNDIETLREKTLILVESNTEYVALLNDSFKYARNITAILSVVVGVLCIYTFRLRSKFLTNS